MSRFRVLAILPTDGDPHHPQALVEALLAPYAVDRPVPPHLTPCFCQWQTAWDALATREAQALGYPSYADWVAHMARAAEAAGLETWHTLPAARAVLDRLALATTIAAAAQPTDPTCRDCPAPGIGLTLSTQNSQGFWDTWHLAHEPPFRLADYAHPTPPFAIVTPDGGWHAAWATPANLILQHALVVPPYTAAISPKDWEVRWDRIRHEYGDHWAVWIECEG